MRLGAVLGVAGVCALSGAARGQNLIANGGFETGSLSSWTVAARPLGTPYESGTAAVAGFYADTEADNDPVTPGAQLLAPVSGLPTLEPVSGNFFALSDMTAASTTALLQSFTTAPNAFQVNIVFDMYVYDWSGSSAYDATAGLDHTTANSNQSARVDLLLSSALAGGGDALFTTAPSAIQATLFGPGADPESQGASPTAPFFRRYNQVIPVAPGTSYTLRFAAVNNQFVINQAIDNVVAVQQVQSPEPGAGLLALTALCLPVVNRAVRKVRKSR